MWILSHCADKEHTASEKEARVLWVLEAGKLWSQCWLEARAECSVYPGEVLPWARCTWPGAWLPACCGGHLLQLGLRHSALDLHWGHPDGGGPRCPVM